MKWQPFMGGPSWCIRDKAYYIVMLTTYGRDQWQVHVWDDNKKTWGCEVLLDAMSLSEAKKVAATIAMLHGVPAVEMEETSAKEKT